MFVDTSAIVAILVVEQDGPSLQQRLMAAERAHTSALAIYEAVLGIARVLNLPVAEVRSEVDKFLMDSNLQTVAITAEIARLALDAFHRFGRGRHPARLNMGDCFAYACARSLGAPLLYKGDDFSQTDIAPA